MKTYIFFILLFLLFIIPKFNAQTNIPGGWECGTNDMMLRSATSGGYSANGYPFTPKGDLRVLIICAGFGTNYDSQYVSGWDSAPDALPDILKTGSLFYTDYSQFPSSISNLPASAIQNVSAFYYAMSRGQFRLITNVYPKRININPGTGNWYTAASKVIAQMKIENPNFDWSPYDNRKNMPMYQSDNRNTSPDKKPDYVIIIYRYDQSFTNFPFGQPPGGGYAAIDLSSSDNYNGYTFDRYCGYTQFTGGGYFMSMFIHEVAHTLYDAPHIAGANGVMGNYLFIEDGGWSQMGQEYKPFVCSNAWERWYLDWIDGIKASGVTADIQSPSNLTSSSEYILGDFITTGDAVRIKIPNGTGVNQYLWLENHQGKSVFDGLLLTKDGCNNNFPNPPRGIVAYIESINDNKNNTGGTVESGKNGIKYLHAAGNFDYDYADKKIECWYDNDVYNFHRANINPISGQCGGQYIANDFNNNSEIEVCNNSNGPKDCSPSVYFKNDHKYLLKIDGTYLYEFLNGDRAFAAGRKLSMASNPCLINRPLYDRATDKTGIYYLNGISVSVLSYDSNGNAKIKIQYKDVDIPNDTRYAGTINLPDINGDANPDINLLANVTLQIDKSGTPNKRLKTVAGDFINPTVFTCLSNSYFKQNPYSKVWVENGSSLIIESGAKYEVNSNAELVVKSGSSLTVKSGGILTLNKAAQFTVEYGATFIVEQGAIIN